MNAGLAIMTALVALAIGVWFLLVQQVRVKPWLETGLAPVPAPGRPPPQLVGLGVFLAVITALFALFGAAYHMRMAGADWTHLPLPRLLWLNTALLVCGSVAMQGAATASVRGLAELPAIRRRLQFGGVLAVAFLAGQLAAWQQLDADGFYFSCTPASAFFFVLSGLHGLHLIGGLLVWARTLLTLDAGVPAASDLLAIRLCAIYWHYLLLIWLAVYALFALT